MGMGECCFLVLEYVLAFILPPAAVAVRTQAVGPSFWLNVVLTILGWLPGIIHAIFILLTAAPRRTLGGPPVGAAAV